MQGEDGTASDLIPAQPGQEQEAEEVQLQQHNEELLSQTAVSQLDPLAVQMRADSVPVRLFPIQVP